MLRLQSLIWMHESKFLFTFQDGGRYKIMTSQVPNSSKLNYNYMFVTLESAPKV